jgi:hypothetical protein
MKQGTVHEESFHLAFHLSLCETTNTCHWCINRVQTVVAAAKKFPQNNARALKA